MNVQQAHRASNSSTLKGVADSLSSILDNTFGTYSAAQLMIQDDKTTTNAEIEEIAVIFGSSGYIYSILAINLIICLIYLAEVARTRAWRDLSRLNFIDVKSVIVGASNGGTAIAARARFIHQAQGSSWFAAENDSLVGKIPIRFDRSPKGDMAVVLAESAKEGASKALISESESDGR